jgi:hypothetical protein
VIEEKKINDKNRKQKRKNVDYCGKALCFLIYVVRFKTLARTYGSS